MLNYFNYFTEIEERFQRRRGTLTFLSTLDWALIETWREAGIPLEAVLRGIDAAFDKHDARVAKGAGRVRKVNGLAWAAQSVMQATEEMKEAAVGAAGPASASASAEARESGFEVERVAAYLQRNAQSLHAAALPPPADEPVAAIAARLGDLAAGMQDSPSKSPSMEEVERTLTVLEEKLFAALTLVIAEEEQAAWREQAERGLAPNRAGMPAVQVKQVTQQFLNKRMLEARGLPRLSLFYMEHR